MRFNFFISPLGKRYNTCVTCFILFDLQLGFHFLFLSFLILCKKYSECIELFSKKVNLKQIKIMIIFTFAVFIMSLNYLLYGFLGLYFSNHNVDLYEKCYISRSSNKAFNFFSKKELKKLFYEK